METTNSLHEPLAAIALAALFAAGLAGAAALAEYRTQSAFSFGAVDIAASSTIAGEPSMLAEQDCAARCTIITNKGAACWIRCSNTYARGHETVQQTDCAPDQDNTWIRARDGWYYLSQPLEESGRAPFRECLANPPAWKDSPTDFQLEATLHIEAIQARNFTPDFSSETPWGNVKAEKNTLASSKEVLP